MSSLKSRRPAPYHATLAILDTLDHLDDWKKHAVQRQFDLGIRERAAELGYTLERHWIGQSAEGTRLNRVLQARGIRGILMTPIADPLLPIPSLMDWRHFACVTVGFRLIDPPFHFCTNDQLSSAELAFNRLHAKGYRRIGLITSDYLEFVVDSKFSLGFRHAAEVLGIRLPASFAHRIRDDGSDPHRIAGWLKSYEPDVVCGVQSDLDRIAALPSRSNPRRPLLACLDLVDVEEKLPSRPESLSSQPGIQQNNRQVGASAVDLLVQLLHKGSFGIPSSTYGMIIEGTWKEGTAGRPQPARSARRNKKGNPAAQRLAH